MNRGTTLHLLTHAEQKLAGRITSQEKNPTQNSGVVNSSAKVTNIFFEFDLIFPFQICLTLMTFGSTTFAQRNFNALNELEEASVAPIKSSKSLVPIKLDFAPLKTEVLVLIDGGRKVTISALKLLLPATIQVLSA